ncbi:hypothetical protein V5799_019006 [Amblyomma americanum]|uniref:Uncharacterized protein n=1 Tax=Amblyomma americanum TaxID=6943 RepID=A0AAQ4EXL0_AMBAM
MTAEESNGRPSLQQHRTGIPQSGQIKEHSSGKERQSCIAAEQRSYKKQRQIKRTAAASNESPSSQQHSTGTPQRDEIKGDSSGKKRQYFIVGAQHSNNRER